MLTRLQILAYAVFGAEVRAKQELDSIQELWDFAPSFETEILNRVRLASEYMEDASELSRMWDNDAELPKD